MSEDTDVLAALKQWGEMAYEGDPIVDVLLNDISRAADRIQGLEDVLEEKRLAVNGLRSALSTSQARLSEAVKVLEAYLNEYEGVYDMAATKERPAYRSDGAKAAEDAVRQFLATIGEENEA